jgi:hypothetical protein
LITRLMHHDNSTLLLLLPGMLALPVYALVPCLLGEAVPLSKPTEEAKSTAGDEVFWRHADFNGGLRDCLLGVDLRAGSGG